MRYLVELMDAESVTVEQVAHACGHRPATVLRWLENEGRGFSVGEILDIHDALFNHMTMCEFVGAIAPGNKLD